MLRHKTWGVGRQFQRIGIDRQAVIKSWIMQRLDENTTHKKAV